jgi:VanZ family protein
VTDIAVDTAGILIGYAVAVLMNVIINKIQKKKGT